MRCMYAYNPLLETARSVKNVWVSIVGDNDNGMCGWMCGWHQDFDYGLSLLSISTKRISANDWSQLLLPNGNITVRGTPLDGERAFHRPCFSGIL